MNWRLFCITTLSFFLLTLFLYSDEIWEGNATQIRRGEFESDGYFAASNSFPNGTVVEVENIRNGRSVQVTVLKRIGDNPNLFLLLSDKAAQRLGINKGDVERVRVVIVPDFGSDVPPGAEELTSSQDPDINPNVGLPEEEVEEVAGAKEEIPRVEETEEAVREVGVAEVVQAAEAGKETSPEEALIAEKAARDPQKELYSEPREGESSVALEVESPRVEVAEEQKEEPGLKEEIQAADVAETTPEPPQPTRETLMAVGTLDPLPPEETESATPAGAPEETLDPPRFEESLEMALVPEDPQLPSETTPETGVDPPAVGIGEEIAFSPGDPSPPEDTDLAKPTESLNPPQLEESEAIAISPDEPEMPEEKTAEVAEAPSKPPELEIGERIAVRPNEPEPREETAIETPQTTEKTEEGAVGEEKVEVSREAEVAAAIERKGPDLSARPELIGDLTKGRTYFVQLGAYSDEALARSLEATYSKNYPIEVATTGSGARGIYRVLVGPLSEDESGTVLYWFRARGFNDAFVRSAD